MAEFFIQIALAVPALVVWFAVVTLLGRTFGVGLPLRVFVRRNGPPQRLTFSQHVWFMGVFGWGCGMWIVTTLGDYLDCRYWNGSAHDLSVGRLLFHAVLWPLGGVLYGWMTWKSGNGQMRN